MFVKTTAPEGAQGASAAMPRHGWMKSIALHLLPGIPIVVGFLAIGFVTKDNPAWTPFYSLVLAALFVEFPFLIWLTRYLISREIRAGQVENREAGIPYRARQPMWVWLVAVLLIIVAGGLNMAVTEPLSAPFSALQAAYPDWAILNFDPRSFGRAYVASPPLFIGMWVLSLPALMVAGGIAQEYYFRGYLLPRMPKAGFGAPLANALLFSVFHLTSPWAIIARLPYVLIFSLTAFWRRSLNLGIFIHAGMGIALFSLSSVFLYIGISRALG
jgi:CAAX protease family protein